MDKLFGQRLKKENSGAITILLLGETGVGKSTWINGFANYLEYESLEKAMASPNPPICLIPTKFTMTDENGKQHKIKCGSEFDNNENMRDGQSATQYPQSYIFVPKSGANGVTIRLIDTPGIGDTRKLTQDEKNLEAILNHISHLDEIHVICILLKPNDARLGLMFSFCVKELMTHLHKDACRNIVFCFTNTMGTFYKPGETLNTLTELLGSDRILEMIPLDKSTIYCTDNAAIRLLYAQAQGFQFSPEDLKNYEVSWVKSASDIRRLVEYAKHQIPHQVSDTFSLNNARKIIFLLQNPIAETARNIQINKAWAAERKDTIEKRKDQGQGPDKVEAVEDMPTQQIDLIMTPLTAPRTICTAEKCVEYINVGIYPKTHYKATCHENCSRGKQRNFKIANIIGHKSLSKCSAFDRDGVCKRCMCHWKHHMKITYETRAEIKIMQKQISGDSNSTSTADKGRLEKELEDLEARIKEFEFEETEITNASAMFAIFLNQNSITPYNNSKNKYLAHMIEDEERKQGRGGDSRILDGLKEMARKFDEQIKILQCNFQRVQGEGLFISIDQLNDTLKKLFELKHNGNKLARNLGAMMKTEQTDFVEKIFDSNTPPSAAGLNFATPADTDVPKSADSNVPTSADSKVPIFADSKIPIFADSKVPVSDDSNTPASTKPRPPTPPPKANKPKFVNAAKIISGIDTGDTDFLKNRIKNLRSVKKPPNFSPQPSTETLDDDEGIVAAAAAEDTMKNSTQWQRRDTPHPSGIAKLVGGRQIDPFINFEKTTTSSTNSSNDSGWSSDTVPFVAPPQQQYGATEENVPLIPRDELDAKDRLGAGGFGVVYSGTWNKSPCAIKRVRDIIMNEAEYETVIQECKIQFNLRHPNIIELFGVSYEKDLWIVMTLIEGENLYRLIVDSGSRVHQKMTIGQKLRIAVQVTSAISYIHSKGYLHNDIKPENMMYEHKTEKVYICDFGISRYLGDIDLRAFYVQYTSTFCGTFAYIAPECFQQEPGGKRHVRPTFKSDVWALGAVFAEIFAEKSLFSDDMSMLKCKVDRKFGGVHLFVNSRIAPPLQPIIKASLSLLPEDRPVVDEMNRFFESLMSK